MSDFLKCECPHCNQRLEFSPEGLGQTVACPICQNSIELTIENSILKCACWYCGRLIEFPSKITGISISCLTCRKPVTLKREGLTTDFGSIVFPNSESTAIAPDFFGANEKPMELKADAEDILYTQTGISQLEHVRQQPATEKQKEKLHWFGCTFDKNLTKGQAGDALDKCVRDFPKKERAYYERPATDEQMAALKAYYGKDLDDIEGPFTYKRAKDLILQIEIEKRTQQREYEFSEDGQIDEMTEFINGCGVNPRKITRAEIAKAWKLAKSRNVDKSYSPSDYAIVGALCELFSDLKSMRNDY